jgi:predicted dehydrogenase
VQCGDQEPDGERYPKIAIVGCGAICESYYLPALRGHREVLKQLILVDTNEERRRKVEVAFGAKRGIQDYSEILGEVDGVIVATPHWSHHQIAMDFLREHAHVLCEKPFALLFSDAREMIAQAERSSVTLSVNNILRLYPSYNTVKKLLSDESLGQIRSITYYDGEAFGWPTVSGFYFSKQSSKGVLLDQGAHAVDAVCWWMGCKPELISCQTDSFGGPEAAVSVKFRHGSCVGEVRLSWLAKLQNRYSLNCENGQIWGGTKDWGRFGLKLDSAEPRTVEVDSTTNYEPILRQRMVDNFLSVIEGRAEPLVPAEEVVQSIQFIDESYSAAERFSMPWCDNIECV